MLLARVRVLVFLWLAVSQTEGAELRVVGTDLLGADFSKAVYSAAAKQRVPIALALDGSRPGFEVLKAGRADIALLVLPANESEMPADVFQEVVAYHCVMVLAPADCPVARITLPQLAAIFGARGGGSNTWSELHAAGEWASKPIVPLLPESGSSLAPEIFRHLVLGDGELKSNLSRYRALEELRSAFGGESRALAIGNSPPRDFEAARVVAVASKPNASAVLPTPDTLHRGEYPLRLPVLVVARRERLPEARPLLQWLRSDEAAAAFERAEVVPVPAGVRAKRREDGDLR